MDDVWLGRQSNFSFPEVERIYTYDDNYVSDSGYLVAVYVRVDKNYNIYERQVSDLITVIASIGGLGKALSAVGMIFVTLFA